MFADVQKLGPSRLAELGSANLKTMKGYLQGLALPNSSTLASLAKNTELNVNWLLTGEGEMLIQQGTKPDPPTPAATMPGPERTEQTELERDLAAIERSLKGVGATDEELKQALLARIQGGPPKRHGGPVGYGSAHEEPVRYLRVAEDVSKYGDEGGK